MNGCLLQEGMNALPLKLEYSLEMDTGTTPGASARLDKYMAGG